MTKSEFMARAIQDLPKVKARKRRQREQLAAGYFIDTVREMKQGKRRRK